MLADIVILFYLSLYSDYQILEIVPSTSVLNTIQPILLNNSFPYTNETISCDLPTQDAQSSIPFDDMPDIDNNPVSAMRFLNVEDRGNNILLFIY
jgi:hypothetical protein